MGKHNILSLLFFAAVIAAIPLLIQLKLVNSYWLTILIFVGIDSLVTIGLSLLMGYAGQISLGHGAFIGLGAYASGLMTTQLGWNPWLAMILALLLTSAVALLIGIPSLRLHGHYLAMATLAFGEIVVIALTAEINLTGGPSGFGEIPNLSLGFIRLDTNLKYYVFVWTAAACVMILALNIIHSRVGRALRSIHGGELAANAMGVDATIYKIQVFVLSAALASLAGSFYAHYVTFISPQCCSLKVSVMLVVMVAVGGMNSLWGAVLGAFLMRVLPQYLRVFKDYDILIYGLVLMVIMIFSPGGIFGALQSAVARLRSGIDSIRREAA
ncbi:MAG: branched-chain amino acid ABC transporter permease [Candidatus Omnitrophota bacterium]